MFRTNKRYWLYLAPAFIILFIFVVFPIFNTIWLSFHDKQGNISLETYEYVLTNDKFQEAVKHTIIYALIVTPITLFLSLMISYLLSLKIKFKNVFQTIYFLPYVTSTIAIGAVWALMYHTDYGVFNQIIMFFGGDPIGWLTDPNFALLSLIIFGIWKGLAFNILILFTAIAGIDDNLDKAALVDGTSSIKTFFKIKLPQIYPVIAYLIIMQMIHSVKVFEEVVALFGNTTGPDNSANTLVYYIQDYIVMDPTVAAVASVMLLSLTLILTFINKKTSKLFSRGGN